jgi:hypothetical protein
METENDETGGIPSEVDEDQHDPSSEGVAADADDATDPAGDPEPTVQEEAKPREIPRGKSH